MHQSGSRKPVSLSVGPAFRQAMCLNSLGPSRMRDGRYKSASRMTWHTDSSDPGGKLCPGANDRGVALGTRRNHADFNAQKIGDELQVVHGPARELRRVLNSVGVRLPAGECAIFGRDLGQILGR